MTKIRVTGMPNDYGLIEETDLNTMNTTRRIPIKRRLLADDEKIYGIQRLWTSANSKFVLVKKVEYSETNTNKAFTDKFLFRSLARQKSIDRGSHEGNHLELSHQHQNNNLLFKVDTHADHPSKLRTPNSLTPTSAMNGNLINRTTLAPTPPIPKTHHNNKRSLKTILSTLKS